MNFHIILITFFLLLFVDLVNAQNPAIPKGKNVEDMISIDSANVRVLYALNAQEISEPKTYDDLQRLDIGKYTSKYYSFFVFNSDSLLTEWHKKNKEAQSTPNRLGIRGKCSYWSEYFYSEYFKDFSLNTFTEYSRMPFYLQRLDCKYTEKISVQNWVIQEDTLNIIGYHCQKATCIFRGREYIAWFSTDIPISNGPWKFGGLPGLILKVYDKDHLFVFECVGIEWREKRIPIKIYNDYNQYQKQKREYILKLQKKINENYAGVVGLRLVKGQQPKTEKRFSLELE